MITLYHHPLCAHSRFVRLLLGEYGLEPRLVEENVAERREDFLILDPAGETPLLIEPPDVVVPGAALIADWLDETRGRRSAATGCCPTIRRSGSRCAG